MTAQLQGPGSFTLVSIELRTPSLGYTSPLGYASPSVLVRNPEMAGLHLHCSCYGTDCVLVVHRQAILFTSFGAQPSLHCWLLMSPTGLGSMLHSAHLPHTS